MKTSMKNLTLFLLSISFSGSCFASLRQQALRELETSSKKSISKKNASSVWPSTTSDIVNVSTDSVAGAQESSKVQGNWTVKASVLQNRGTLQTASFGAVNLSSLPMTPAMEVGYQWSPLRSFQFQDRNFSLGASLGWEYNQQSSDVRSPQGTLQENFTLHHSLFSSSILLSTKWGRKDLWTLQSGLTAGFDFAYQTSAHPELQKTEVLPFLGIQASALYQSASGIKIGPALQLRTLAGLSPFEIGIQGSLPW